MTEEEVVVRLTRQEAEWGRDGLNHAMRARAELDMAKAAPLERVRDKIVAALAGPGEDSGESSLGWYDHFQGAPVCDTCGSDDPAIHKLSNAFDSPADYPDDKLCPDAFHPRDDSEGGGTDGRSTVGSAPSLAACPTCGSDSPLWDVAWRFTGPKHPGYLRPRSLGPPCPDTFHNQPGGED